MVKNFELSNAFMGHSRMSPEGNINLHVHTEIRTCGIWKKYPCLWNGLLKGVGYKEGYKGSLKTVLTGTGVLWDNNHQLREVSNYDVVAQPE